MDRSRRAGIIIPSGNRDLLKDLSRDPSSLRRSFTSLTLEGLLNAPQSEIDVYSDANQNTNRDKNRFSVASEDTEFDDKENRRRSSKRFSMASTVSSSSSFKTVAQKVANKITSVSVHSDSSRESTPLRSTCKPGVVGINRSSTASFSADSRRNSRISDHDTDSLQTSAASKKRFSLRMTPSTESNSFVPETSTQSLRNSISMRSSLFRPRLNSFNSEQDNSSIASTATSHTLRLRKSFRSLKSKVSLESINSFDKTQISLPVPQASSKDKLKHKLKNSSSILSINTIDSQETKVESIPQEEFDSYQFNHLLSLCTLSKSVVPFENFVAARIQKHVKLTKINEASHSEVFAESCPLTGSPQSVWKVIPFGKDEFDQTPIRDLIQEVSITQRLSNLEGFVQLQGCVVVTGNYPKELLRCWDNYNGSTNSRPDFYTKNQNYLVMILNYGGTNLSKAHLSSWTQVKELFWGIVKLIEKAENLYGFEHRDLHWDNIVVDANMKPTLINYAYSRIEGPHQVLFTGLSHQNFFKGRGGYQFEIYRLMRQNLKDGDPHNNSKRSSLRSSRSVSSHSLSSLLKYEKHDEEVDWSQLCPQTNLLWIHYLLDKLLYNNGLKHFTLQDRRDNDEYRAFVQMMIVYKSLDPRIPKKSRFKTRRKKGEWETFHDFRRTTDVLVWAGRNKLLEN
ncbi:BA75_04946T0 [Komagataella pastoris]|uniref:non-specific serine/threonine protein kinase n=1 Tax=Komagataella pastoris TaxID=4922 RepID=A0A1B2JIG5_PICPA|nr:BA75_04946T0 [Komagataella pastoris]